jgi:hypothetical protein
MTHLAEVVVEGYLPAAIEHTFDTIVPIDLTTVFRGLGPLPAVAGVRDQSGPWESVGANRVVRLSDGSEAPERITAYERPSYFAYRVGPFDPIHGLVAAHADGGWWFADMGDGRTHIRWSYTFALEGPGALLARVAMPRIWRPYARRVLAACSDAAVGRDAAAAVSGAVRGGTWRDSTM